MSNSRLEKFIYAICSMEVSDLPAPLSRIEKLWNCLITGETPDFEPLSRNEKYLMAMLDRYDISNLPAPMSRGEKLLYKIAMGETDLSDVPGYLSRYEELLKYLIENGGISGGDFEYVLYTLNQSLSTLYATVEKPVKSAILSGQTLVNLLDTEMLKDDNNINALAGVTLDKDYFISGDHTAGQFQISKDNKSPLEGKLMEGKTYTLVMTVNTTDKTSDGADVYLGLNTTTHKTGTNFLDNANGVVKIKFTPSVKETPSTSSMFQIGFYNRAVVKISRKIMLLEGDYTNVDIPYFEGMQSVKMPVLTTTGKNLFDKEAFYNDWKGKEETYMYKETVDGEEVLKVNNMNLLFSDSKGFKISVKKGVPLTMSFKCKKAGTLDTKAIFSVRFTDTSFKDIGRCSSYEWTQSSESFTPTRDYITVCSAYEKDDYFYVKDIQLEYDTQLTTYEPYKSNILSTSEDITLRGIGDVQDTLDCLTGEVINNVGKFIFDGTHDYGVGTTGDVTRISISNVNARPKTQPICDKLKSILYTDSNQLGSELACIHHTNDRIDIYISTSKCGATIDEIKTYLTTNPITVQYQLATESVKTVDLATVDQDGQPTKLKTFNDITYVEINADNLIPSVDVEVATKISETLATLDPQQNDISNTQNKLGQTIEEQTENTDATMMATTEIYEQTL